MPTLVSHSYDTPFGILTVIGTAEDGVVRASGFRSAGETAATLPRRLSTLPVGEGEIPAASRAISAWLEGDGSLLGSVPAEQDGGPFFQAAWRALREVPSGTAVSYLELAQMAGSPRAMRAAGQACARNALAPFVPCHRVVKSGGELGYYGFGGPDAKAAMLALEGATEFGGARALALTGAR
jgi:methylated-DNA-[protein]-cysteine S-methyltransferase